MADSQGSQGGGHNISLNLNLKIGIFMTLNLHMDIDPTKDIMINVWPYDHHKEWWNT